jgi:hypothetical protein
VSRGQDEHFCGELVLHDYGVLFAGMPQYTTLHDAGGRLSKKLVQAFADKIDEFFGEETASFVDTRATLLLDEKGD